MPTRSICSSWQLGAKTEDARKAVSETPCLPWLRTRFSQRGHRHIVKDSSGRVVASFNETLDGGNIQSTRLYPDGQTS